jgi:hypothetical protein
MSQTYPTLLQYTPRSSNPLPTIPHHSSVFFAQGPPPAAEEELLYENSQSVA